MAFPGRNNLSLSQRIIRGLLNQRHTDDMEPFQWDWDERRDNFNRWESLYANAIYNDQADGGLREVILQEELKKTDTSLPLHGFFNPIGSIVDTYQNVLRGQWGVELKPAETVDGQPVNEKLLNPLARIWRWSNLNNQKESLQHWCANLGTVGLRVDAFGSAPDGSELDAAKRRVRIRPVHPAEIVDFDEDGQGNVTDVLLEYQIVEGELGENRGDDYITYRERLNKREFIRYRKGAEQERIPNALGICPFVLLQHKSVGAEFGIPAHFGSEQVIHQINWLLTRIGISVDRHVFAKWFACAGGAMPTTFPLDDTTVAYVQTGPGDTAPKLEAIVAKLDFIGIQNVLMMLVNHIRLRQPELTLAYLEALSGQSGETIAKLLIPCEDRIMTARAHYEHALVRAMQIGVSWGVLFGMWDIGTGGGNAQAADLAYQQGLEEFAFAERSALPETVYDKAKRAEADAAGETRKAANVKTLTGIYSTREQLRMMNKTTAEVDQIMKERAEEDVIPTPGQGL